MNKRKAVSKTTIALVFLIVVVIAALLGTTVYYSSLISQKNNTITSLNNQLSSDSNTIASLENEVSSLQSEVSNLSGIINLQDSEVWVPSQTISQPAGYYTYYTFSANYPGYIVVNVQSSTTTNTYVVVTWSAYGISYYQTIQVGASGTATFPVLPTFNVTVMIGNTNLFNGATETVSIIYYY